ncbi:MULTISPECIES: hypothetical protein [Microbacterium]|uniref:Uncharacterized protein n=1 Tax=Microbacterium wangchenii TaxID=2541726 RepID=A0ABX5SS09_9MICO|nr:MULTISPECIES: hypothetical protein [Microbacterium]MCK6068364.1 hypothetical protein [Microbacterium sp. EYE_512]QBR87639.1 hypothetical protein E4K62_02345 [Microbacterium wangchenii]TFV84280.1 hypothetical protein E4V99_04235 [Microbacterium sp. dk485]TXK15907.1 hypothetical protein FVP99_10445 [Microbacterium wangchenii]
MRRSLVLVAAAAALTLTVSGCGAAEPPPAAVGSLSLQDEIERQAGIRVEETGISKAQAIEELIVEGILGAFPPEELLQAGYDVEEVSRMLGIALAPEPYLAGGTRERWEDAGIDIPTVLSALAAATRGMPDSDAFAWVVRTQFATPAEASAAGLSPAAGAGWGEPAVWAREMPPPTGLDVRSIRFAVGVDGSLREATLVVDGTSDEAVSAWMAALPDVPVTTHTSSSTASGDTEVWLTSGAKVSDAFDGLPPAWTAALPLGGLAYGWAGVEHEVRFDGVPPALPSFHLVLQESNRIDVYRQWIAASGQWTFTLEDGQVFRAENADFVVQGMRATDGTDELTITAKRWDIPGLDGLRP